jgi:hypothetical protein
MVRVCLKNGEGAGRMVRVCVNNGEGTVCVFSVALSHCPSLTPSCMFPM